MLREMLIFALLFAVQIWLVSYYFARKASQRARMMIESHPPADYPKLYPQPIEYYRMAIFVFEWSNRALVLFGAGILLAVIFLVDHSSFADDGHISEFWPALFGMLQFLPWMAQELMGYRQFKLMREARASSTRRANLKPRRLLAVVSPGLLLATVAIALGSVLFDFYVHDFELAWNDSMQRTLTLVMTNVFMAAVGAWQLFGRKQDPHQHPADHELLVSIQMKSLLFTSMALSVFFMSQAAEDVVDLGSIEASLMSVFFTTVAALSLGTALNRLKPEDLNFEVYRDTPAAS